VDFQASRKCVQGNDNNGKGVLMNRVASNPLSVIVLLVGLLSNSGFAQSSKPSTSKPATPSSATRTNTSAAPSNCGLFAGDGSGRSSGTGACPTVNTTSQSTVALPNSAARGGSRGLGAIQGLLNGMATSMTNLANTANTPVGDTGGVCYWSSEWNGLSPELQGRLRQHQTIDTVITQYGGPAQLISYAQTSGNLEREFASLQGPGLGTEADFKSMADGFVDVAKCRLGQSATQQFTAPPPLIDTKTFKAAGSDPLTTAMDTLVNDSSPSADQLLMGLQAVVDAGDKWEVTKGVKDITGPFNQLSDALTRAGAAAGGQNTICPVDGVNGLFDYVLKQEAYLKQLSQKPESYWLDASGVNAQVRSTVPTAQAYLDNWSDRLARVQRLINELTPMVRVSEGALANPSVLAAYEYRGYMTDVTGCSDVLGQTVTHLDLASGEIDKVKAQLSDARSVVY
jgi:hypothetical protein